MKDSYILFKIDDFARDLSNLAIDFDVKPLIKYAQSIKDDVEIVNLDSLQKTLKQFPVFIDMLVNIIKTK